uniref:Immunity protein n=1 Tax=Parastrongyloides trichosuri TaxID=131310 RepID=A0A0N5A486_PARTI
MKINTYQKYFYIIYSVVLIFSYLITQNNGLTGIMVLNIFYILFLIFYNFYKISIKERKFVKPINEFFPTLNSLVLLIFASLVTRLSYLIFGTAEGIINNAAHMAIGGIMLIVFIFQLLQNDFPKYNPMHCLLEKTHCN